MKWIVSINVFFLIMIGMVDMSAQSLYKQNDTYKYRAGRIYQGDYRLSKEELQNVLNADDFDRYLSGRKLLVSGSVMTAVGGAFAVVNAALLADHLNSNSNDPLHTVDVSHIIYVGNAILGGAVMLAGVPCLCVGVNRLKKVAGQMKSSEVSLEYTGTGLSLAFRF